MDAIVLGKINNYLQKYQNDTFIDKFAEVYEYKSTDTEYAYIAQRRFLCKLNNVAFFTTSSSSDIYSLNIDSSIKLHESMTKLNNFTASKIYYQILNNDKILFVYSYEQSTVYFYAFIYDTQTKTKSSEVTLRYGTGYSLDAIAYDDYSNKLYVSWYSSNYIIDKFDINLLNNTISFNTQIYNNSSVRVVKGIKTFNGSVYYVLLQTSGNTYLYKTTNLDGLITNLTPYDFGIIISQSRVAYWGWGTVYVILWNLEKNNFLNFYLCYASDYSKGNLVSIDLTNLTIQSSFNYFGESNFSQWLMYNDMLFRINILSASENVDGKFSSNAIQIIFSFLDKNNVLRGISYFTNLFIIPTFISSSIPYVTRYYGQGLIYHNNKLYLSIGYNKYHSVSNTVGLAIIEDYLPILQNIYIKYCI